MGTYETYPTGNEMRSLEVEIFIFFGILLPIVPSLTGQLAKMCAVVEKNGQTLALSHFQGAWAGPWRGPAACARLQPVGL